MEKVDLDYEEVGYFSEIIRNYINESEELKPFYKYSVDIASFEQLMIDKAKDHVNREILVQALRIQNESYLPRFEKVKSNIDSLSDEATFTITTGHQLCIAGGPLYFIYKVVSILNLCEQLGEKYPDNKFVPVFWLASEDHGEGEITNIHLFNKTLSWNHEEKGASGKRSTQPYEEIDVALRNIFSEDSSVIPLVDKLRQSYLDSDNLAEATRSYLYELFGKYGLVIIDGDDPLLKKEFASNVQDELRNASTIKNVKQTIERFPEKYKAQAHVRDINLFYLGEGFRERITKDGDSYAVLNSEKTFTEVTIQEELESHPENFSPNVLLRPLYQEKILPNLAYIGGPGESAYWFQLKSNFEYHGVNFPMVILRDSVQWMDKGSQKKLSKLGFSIKDIFQKIEVLEKRYLEVHASTFDIGNFRDELSKNYDLLKAQVAEIDSSLVASVDGEKAKQIKGLQAIEGKVNRAIKRKHEVELNQLKKVKDKLFPEGGLQERYDSFIPYYEKYGDEFIPILLQHLDVLDKKFTVLVE